jgi:hypothetical protein
MKRFLLPLLAAAFAIVSATAAARAQNAESAYTDFNTKKCQHTPGKDAEDYGEWLCQGYDGIPVWMSAGDQRIVVSYGHRAKLEPAARQTLDSFNGEGNRIEWRIRPDAKGKKRPFATIMRWSTTHTDARGEPVRGAVLVVTRLGIAGVCHIGYVDGQANANANELARQIADQYAREFICRRDKPIVLGKTGPGFSKAYDLDEK